MVTQGFGIGDWATAPHADGNQAHVGWRLWRTPTGVSGLVGAAGRGAAAGLAGAVVMTLGEKIEQRITGRPDSFVPARTLLALLGRRPREQARPLAANLAMHYGTGAAVGALCGVWAETGLRGPGWSLAHAVVRLCTDQTLENATGVGAPPQSWPGREHVADLLHKGVYSLATGLVADRLIPERPRPLPGRTSH